MEIFLTGLRQVVVKLSCALCILSVASHFTITCPAQDQQQVNPRKYNFQKLSNSDRQTQSKDAFRAKPMRPVFSGLDNPEASELLGQLQSHEAAAAAEAEAIRQQDRDTQSRPGEPTIEQRKAILMRHLDSAFDLKLKLEDLQIKQLQSRLSQLERQTTERKSLRDKIVKRRAAELLDGDALQWQPWSANFEAAKATSGARRSYEEIDQTIESVREKMRPFIEQVTACQERVRELEPLYFHDHSNSAELQAALDALTEARRTFRREMEPFQVVFDQALKKLEVARVAAEKVRDAMMAKSEKKALLVADGEATESELRDAIAASERAGDAANLANYKLRKFLSDSASLLQHGASNELQQTTTVKPTSKTSTSDIDEFTIYYWFEKVLKLKVEFVQFDGLNLPFKAAVRVRELCGEYPTYFPLQDAKTAGYREGDLIVSLAGNKFETLNQLASALYSFRFDYDNQAQWWVNEALRGGLAGTVVSITESCQRFHNGDWNKLCGGTPQQKIWGFEVVTRTKQTVPTKTIFAIGTCVSPDGVVAVSVPVNQLVDLEALIVTSPPDDIDNHKDENVRIIAVHKTCGLVLVKVEQDDRVFPWMNCRSSVATVGRPLHLFEWRNGKGYSTGQRVTVISPDETGLTVAESGDRDEDRFFILYQADQANSKFSTSLTPGSALTTIDDRELDGIVLSEDDGSSKTLIPESIEIRTCLAANVIDRLIKDYRRSQLNVAAVDNDLQHKPDNRVAEVPRPKRQSAILLSPDVIKSKRELIPKFLLAGSMVSQQSYVTGIARAVDLVSKDRDLLEVVILELKAGMDTDPPRTSVRRLLDVLPKACFSYGLRRWKHEQELPSQILNPAGNVADDANAKTKALDEEDARVLAEIIALGYRADRNTIEHFTCAIRNLHHVDGQGFLRDVLREEPNGHGNPFEDTPFNPSPRDNGVTKKAGSQWEDNMGGGWEEAKFVAAIGLAELGDAEGVLWLLSRAKPNPFGIDGNLSYYPHSRSKTESHRESCQQSLVDLFDLKPNATVEELQTWWENNGNMFRPRVVQIGTRKIP